MMLTEKELITRDQASECGWVWLMTDVGLFIERYKFVICMFVDTLF